MESETATVDQPPPFDAPAAWPPPPPAPAVAEVADATQPAVPEATGEVAERGLELRLRAPASPDALGISPAVLEDIVLRQIVTDVRALTTDVAKKLHVNPGVIDTLVASMRDRNLIEYQGMEGRAYVVSATEVGKSHADQRSAECRYIGPMPVSLGLYHEVVRAQHPTVH